MFSGTFDSKSDFDFDESAQATHQTFFFIDYSTTVGRECRYRIIDVSDYRCS